MKILVRGGAGYIASQPPPDSSSVATAYCSSTMKAELGLDRMCEDAWCWQARLPEEFAGAGL